MHSVIGGGPAGCFYASKVDADVTIFEEHRKIGCPISCTGILTDSINRVMKIPKKLIVSKINQFKITSPKKSIYVDLKKTNLVLDRAMFDQHLMEKAVDNGATIRSGEKFVGLTKSHKGYKIQTTKGSYHSDVLVGSDGPFSSVAKATGIYGKREFVKGWQARVKMKDLEEGVTEIFLHRGEFSWIVPEDDSIARVGVIGPDNRKLIEDYKRMLGKAKILEDQSGMIPLYNPRQKLRKGNVFLIGDAATQVKATTYGGIIYGLLAAKYLAEDKNTYVKQFNKKLGKDLWMSLQMRKFMNHMTEKQANELLKVFEKKGNNEILAKYDRDFPSTFMVKLLMKEAKLWKLGFGMFKNRINTQLFEK